MAALRNLGLAAALAASTAGNANPVDRWSDQIAEASARFGIPAAWIRRVIRSESGGLLATGGRPIVSSAGAMGLMQLMPATWRSMRLILGLGGNPHDPHDNILAGSLYLRLMFDRFGYPGLFAAYNAGPARYAEWLHGGRPLPQQTRAYVAGLARPGPANVPVLSHSQNRFPPLFALLPATEAVAAAVASHGEGAFALGKLSPRSGALFVDVGGRSR